MGVSAIAPVKGDKGDPGTNGLNGSDGTNGSNGASGTNGSNGAAGAAGTIVQSGRTTLTLGISGSISANISSASVIDVWLHPPSAGSLTAGYFARGSNRTNGTPGSFKCEARLASGLINILDGSTVEWSVTG